jgi:hypothetical protein
MSHWMTSGRSRLNARRNRMRGAYAHHHRNPGGADQAVAPSAAVSSMVAAPPRQPQARRGGRSGGCTFNKMSLSQRQGQTIWRPTSFMYWF